MTEHSAGVFVFFFLAEYASILLICILTSILFLGGYLHDFTFFISLVNCLQNLTFFNDLVNYLKSLTIFTDSVSYLYHFIFFNDFLEYIYLTLTYLPFISGKHFILDIISSPSLTGIINGVSLGIKSCIMVFIFIWARASLPRIRYDQLMSFC
jgi:NADH-ubiquinone oxidoreductase chain 1